MPFTNAAKNAMLDHLGTLITHVSLHSADPGSGGTSELAGGSPAYTRETIAWAAASTGSMAKTAGNPVFDVEGGDTAAYVGFWSASSGGTFYGSGVLGSPETFGAQGTFTLTGATLSLTG